MANKSLFASLTSRLPQANAVNEAGAELTSSSRSTHWHKLPLRVRSVTRSTARLRRNCRSARADRQVDDNKYLAKLALYARERRS